MEKEVNEFYSDNVGKLFYCPLYCYVFDSTSKECDDFVDEICFKCSNLVEIDLDDMELDNENLSHDIDIAYQCTYKDQTNNTKEAKE